MIQFDEHIFRMGWFNHQLVQYREVIASCNLRLEIAALIFGRSSITLPETNIAPEKWWLEDEFPFGKPYFQVRTVSFREGKLRGFNDLIDAIWHADCWK